ncbi:MAG: acyltransferase [Puniceicoccales bacterium]|jgi:peptidoglycan/LPS O-acetylase OafA/YrhL|nr:acyltransferase [Puniceicoccales bacterium]
MGSKLDTLTQKKPHYHALDGLRGVAALVILIYHYLEMIYPGDNEANWLGHGYLAVDFFFCLSGFVVGYAYDDRMAKIGVWGFFQNRLIRLHPMVILGALLGFIGYLWDPFVVAAYPEIAFPGWGKIFGALGLSLLLVPAPFLPYRWEAISPYNSPAWSLFFEYIANIVYGLFLWRFNRKILLGIGIVCAGWVLAVSYHGGKDPLIGGWDIGTVPDGFARVFFSFIAGLLVFRFKFIWKTRLGFMFPLVLLLGTFVLPHINHDWFVESLLIILIFPLILSVGAGTHVSGFWERFCIFTGRLSYPLYMTHITTVWIFGNYLTLHKPSTEVATLCTIGLIIFNLVIGYLAMRFFDEPLRAWLGKWQKRILANSGK